MAKDQDERARDQWAAETFAPIMVEAFHDSLREIGSLSRWLLATLVAINGAAAISLLPLKMGAAAKLGAAGAFLLGILAAFGAGLWSLYVFNRVSAAAHTMMGYWLSVADDASRLAALETTMKRNMDQAIGSRGTHLLVFISLAAFLVGCVVAGLGMLSQGEL
jgi:hypothetical protein